MIKKPPQELIESFLKWYEADPHSKDENAYSEKITKEYLSALDKDQFISFFSDFSLSGGKVQSGGERSYNRFTTTISGNQYKDFREFVLSVFEPSFDVSQWLEEVKSFKYFGQGLATIFLNRVDKEQFVIVNEKSKKGLEKLGIKLPADLQKQYKLTHEAQAQLRSWFPNLDNFYRVDALMHYIIAENEGQKLTQEWIENDEDLGSPNQIKQGNGRMRCLNQILYGPPGTGKTYNTVIEAVKICDRLDDPVSYDEAKKRYKKLKAEGRIEFVTFHQSYGYEEFIEGIKAKTVNNSIVYSVEDGVLKRMAIEALFASGAKENQGKTIEYHELYDQLITLFKDKGPLLLESKDKKTIELRSISDAGNLHCYHKNGEVRYVASRSRLQKLYEQIDSKTKLERLSNLHSTFTEIIGGANQTVYWAVLHKILALKAEMSNLEYNLSAEAHSTYDSRKAWVMSQENPTFSDTSKPYVLIIDEINRGNISKIFGELITLIEDDKRIGADHEMTVRLPVSGEVFGVPRNLYIIGTINTADRSLAMMDTALRRRFTFKEKMPEPNLLQEKNIEGVDVQKILKVMNQRIEVLYDREHTIGHAYFMSLNKQSNMDDLASIFENKIIPLLAEYFFEDWDKIRMVLGDNQKPDQTYAFIIESKAHDFRKLFGDAEAGDFSDEDKMYIRNAEALNKAESYVGIYQVEAEQGVSE